MKPIIVTYSNESYIMGVISWLSILGDDGIKDIPNTGHHVRNHLMTNEVKRITDKDIKLIARPKK
jgi:hypothetical protein